MTGAGSNQGVMPAYEEARGIRHQLEALAQTLTACAAHADIHFTLLVVNDGSRDDTSGGIARARAALEPLGVALEDTGPELTSPPASAYRRRVRARAQGWGASLPV